LIKLYGIRNCDSCRHAMTWLKQSGVKYHFVDVREDGLDENNLVRWQESLGWELLLNKRSTTWRKLPVADRDDLDSAKARQLILRHPTLMKRPVLEAGTKIRLGFNAADYKNLDL
jgi:arsenate reductase